MMPHGPEEAVVAAGSALTAALNPRVGTPET
jgi:hypothetical protein